MGGHDPYIHIAPGRDVINLLSRKKYLYLMTVGGTSFGGVFARQDRAALHMVLESGFSEGDTLTTFLMSSRGRHCVERRGDEYALKWLTLEIQSLGRHHEANEQERKKYLVWLQEELKSGPMRSAHIERRAREDGMSIRMLKEFREEFGVRVERHRDTRFYWMPSRELYAAK